MGTPIFNCFMLPAVAAVHDGYVLQKSIVRSPLGGKLLSQCMAQMMVNKGATIKPNYSFKRVETSPGQYQVTTYISFCVPKESILTAQKGNEICNPINGSLLCHIVDKSTVGTFLQRQ